MDIVRTVPKTADLGGKDPDHIVELCNEVRTIPVYIFYCLQGCFTYFNWRFICTLCWANFDNWDFPWFRLFKRVIRCFYFVLVEKDANQLRGMFPSTSRNFLQATMMIIVNSLILLQLLMPCEDVLLDWILY